MMKVAKSHLKGLIREELEQVNEIFGIEPNPLQIIDFFEENPEWYAAQEKLVDDYKERAFSKQRIAAATDPLIAAQQHIGSLASDAPPEQRRAAKLEVRKKQQELSRVQRKEAEFLGFTKKSPNTGRYPADDKFWKVHVDLINQWEAERGTLPREIQNAFWELGTAAMAAARVELPFTKEDVQQALQGPEPVSSPPGTPSTGWGSPGETDLSALTRRERGKLGRHTRKQTWSNIKQAIAAGNKWEEGQLKEIIREEITCLVNEKLAEALWSNTALPDDPSTWTKGQKASWADIMHMADLGLGQRRPSKATWLPEDYWKHTFPAMADLDKGSMKEAVEYMKAQCKEMPGANRGWGPYKGTDFPGVAHGDKRECEEAALARWLDASNQGTSLPTGAGPERTRIPSGRGLEEIIREELEATLEEGVSKKKQK